MPTLQNQIQSFADTFARSVIQALRTASIDELGVHARGFSAKRVSSRTGRRNGHATDASEARVAQKRGPTGQKGKRGRKPGRLARRNESDIAVLAERIVAFVSEHPKGVRAEEIRAGLGLAQNEWPRPLAAALAGKRLRKKGQKRATTYFAK